MKEPPFRYPEDTLAGARERFAFYQTQALNLFLEEMVKLGAWLREHAPEFVRFVRWLDAKPNER